MTPQPDPIRLCGVPLVRLAPKDDGWQVQQRPSEDSKAWSDVPEGWFPSYSAALDQAPFLCNF